MLLTTIYASRTALGDQSDATYWDNTAVAGALPQIVSLSTLSALSGPAMAGLIEHVVFEAHCLASVTGGTLESPALAWEGGGVPAGEATTIPTTMGAIESTPQPTRPQGGPWTFADVLALVGVGVQVDAVLAAHGSALLRVAEVRVRVYGPDPDPNTAALVGDLLGGAEGLALVGGTATAGVSAGGLAATLEAED